MDAKPDLTLSAAEQRRRDPAFVARCAIGAFAGRLPLPWPTPPGTPALTKPHFRSAYQPPDPQRLRTLDRAGWQGLALFDLILGLVDFSGLRPVLAARLYRPSARGRVPFDPVSLVLLLAWQTVQGWTRAEALRHLAEPRYAEDAAAFGFHPGVYPTESGLRYVQTALGMATPGALVEQALALVHQTGLLPAAVLAQAVVSFDGMLHDAASRQQCRAVQASCYQPTTPAQPRPCPAKEKGQRGCACATAACQQLCAHAPARDPAARFVWYAGHNRSTHPNAPAAAASAPATPPAAGAAPPTAPHGQGRYGYRSLPAQLVDPVQRVSWTLATAPLLPASSHEEQPAADLLRHVVGAYPWLHVATAVGDAGLGYDAFLATAYELGVRRVVDLRADPRTDRLHDQQLLRGYDAQGWPLCPFGHRLHPNGFDPARRRTKWCCRQTCETPAAPADPPPAPVPLPPCPYRDHAAHPHGLIKNVGKTFADGSLRLVRDVPFGSPAWQALYRRARNAVEGRNAALEGWGLKRLPVFGLARAQATLALADLWNTLTTMARLIKEATLAQFATTAAST